jgi:O-antigen/teichoic acid export membrane protein
MLVTVGLGLATTRLLLATLGAADFGLYAVLTSITGILAGLSAASSTSVQRQLGLEIGREDTIALRRTFATAVVMHAAVALVVVLLGCAVRVYLLEALNISSNRLPAALVAFDATIVGAVASVMLAPVGALYTARQVFGVDAAFATATSACALGIALILPHLTGDLLPRYAWYQAGLQLAVGLVQAAVAAVMFREARISVRDFDRARVRSMAGIAGWSLLGTIAWTLRNGGGGIVLNVFFGTVVNAGYAVAHQGAAYVLSFSNVILRAVQPAMSTLEGRGRPPEFVQLIYATSKLMVLASALIALPLITAPHLALTVWLGQAPGLAAVFLPAILVSILLLHTTVGYEAAMIAAGRLRSYMPVLFLILVSPVPIGAALFLTSAVEPVWYGLLLVASAAAAIGYYSLVAARELRLSGSDWFRSVFLRLLVAIALATGAAASAHAVSPENLAGFVTTSVVGAAAMAAAAWNIVLNPVERLALSTAGRWLK